jgi:hypothetical protein
VTDMKQVMSWFLLLMVGITVASLTTDVYCYFFDSERAETVRFMCKVGTIVIMTAMLVTAVLYV